MRPAAPTSKPEAALHEVVDQLHRIAESSDAKMARGATADPGIVLEQIERGCVIEWLRDQGVDVAGLLEARGAATKRTVIAALQRQADAAHGAEHTGISNGLSLVATLALNAVAELKSHGYASIQARAKRTHNKTPSRS